MNLNELIELIKKSNPAALDSIPQMQVAGILRATANQMRKKLVNASDSEVSIQNLGRFKRKTDGQNTFEFHQSEKNDDQPSEMVEPIKKSNPQLSNIPDAKIGSLVLTAVAQVRGQILAANVGGVQVPIFGRFNIQQVEREKEGKKETVKTITFLLAEQQ